MNPELVLVVGDMFVPQRSPDISDQFKSILIPNKLQHVLSLGNIGSRESNDWPKVFRMTSTRLRVTTTRVTSQRRK